MAFTISINEEAAFEVLFAGPAGPTGPQGIQGIQGVPGEGVAAGGTTGQVLKKLSATDYDTGWSSDISGVAWGGITGTLSSQTDLQNALNAKLSTSAASSTYLPLAGGYITGDIQSSNGSGYRSWDGSTKTTVLLSTYLQLNNSGAGGGALTVEWDGITFQSGKQTLPFLGLAGYATESWVTSNFYPLVGNPSGFLIASALTPYLTSADAAITYQTLAGMSSYLTTSAAASTYYLQTNPDGFITSAALVGYATESFVTSQGYITQTTADGLYYSIGNPSGFIGDAPSDGSTYGRNNGAWTVAGGGTWGSITGTLSNQTDLQSALDLKYDASNPSGFINAINGLQPTFNYSVTVASPTTPDFYSVLAWDKFTFFFLNPVGGLPDSLEYRTDGIFKLDGQEMYPKRTGGSFVGKLLLNQTTINAGLNIGQTQGNVPSNTLAGDVWILDNINFKSSNGTAKVVANTNTANTFTQPQIISTGTSATLPALRITNQSTTGVSLLVEDTTNPDVNSLVVDASGNLGVGVAVGYTATQKVEVVGNVKADGFVNAAGPVFTVKSVAAHAGGANTHDIFMSVGGSTYRLPAIFVSTP